MLVHGSVHGWPVQGRMIWQRGLAEVSCSWNGGQEAERESKEQGGRWILPGQAPGDHLFP